MANTLIEKVSSMGGRLEIEIWSDDLQHAVDGHPEVTIEKVKGTLKDPSKVIQSNELCECMSLLLCRDQDQRNGKFVFLCSGSGYRGW